MHSQIEIKKAKDNWSKYNNYADWKISALWSQNTEMHKEINNKSWNKTSEY